MSALDYVDLFAGPGGWDAAARDLGLLGYGIENDPVVVQTRLAAGLPSLLDDVRNHHARDHQVAGLVASPPCQTFSQAGRGSGHRALDEVLTLASLLVSRRRMAWSPQDERTTLVLEPLRWVLDAAENGTPYQWVVLEQVPTVTPVWVAFAQYLRDLGYSAVVGHLQAEQYGVPQTRRRTVLAASLEGVAALPEPTHRKFHPRVERSAGDSQLEPCVTMADALGWTHPDQYREQVRDQTGTPVDLWWPMHRPSTTVSTRDLVQHPGSVANRWQPGVTKSRNDGIRLRPEQSAALQTFPSGYPFQGSRTRQHQQIGNAIPCLLARAVLGCATATEEAAA
jgi:DNA (cytosine-5)-methyltransferase 1